MPCIKVICIAANITLLAENTNSDDNINECDYGNYFKQFSAF
jgi:hypothetical protein